MKAVVISLALIILVFLCCTKTEESVTTDFDVICRDDSIKTYNPPPPAIIYFHLAITNTGTAQDSFNVYLSDYSVPEGWILQFCNAYS